MQYKQSGGDALTTTRSYQSYPFLLQQGQRGARGR